LLLWRSGHNRQHRCAIMLSIEIIGKMLADLMK